MGIPRLNNLRRLKVRRAQKDNAMPCASEMSALLGCWASTGGNVDVEICKRFESALKGCMKAQGPKVKRTSTINYHLARLYPQISGKPSR